MKSVLFIIKNKMEYGHCHHHHHDHHHGHHGHHGDSCPISGGLFNSAKFVVEMLKDAGVKAHLSGVVDNNDIDREVTKHKPDVCVIEALWVVPSKFDVLTRLHPNVEWLIRIHSKTPFLAQEGVAIDWLLSYLRKRNVSLAFNSTEALADFSTVIEGRQDVEGQLLYLPNYYPLDRLRMAPFDKPDSGIVNVGCFGSVRPFKNQLTQAVAAIKWANSLNKPMKFHINSSRVEQGGESAYRNLKSLFSGSRHHLVEYPWMTHGDFLKALNQNIDVGMQVAFTESFNIVSADYVAAGLPMVVSPEISWSSKFSQASPNSAVDIADTMKLVTSSPFKYISRYLNELGLRHYSDKSKALWLAFLSILGKY